MGSSHEFFCPDCGYPATVSGGDDSGLTCLTTTISCADCGALYDIVLKSWERGERPPRTSTIDPDLPISCPESADHVVNRWRHPGPCPKCGTEMAKHEGRGVDWD